eukprot:1156865-Pelagomonas_calceolata.AAC.11
MEQVGRSTGQRTVFDEGGEAMDPLALLASDQLGGASAGCAPFCFSLPMPIVCLWKVSAWKGPCGHARPASLVLVFGHAWPASLVLAVGHAWPASFVLALGHAWPASLCLH